MIRLTNFLSMVSVCLPSDALLQNLPSYLGFSFLGGGISLHGCSSKMQPVVLTLDEGYLLTAALPDLQPEMAPLSLSMPMQPALRRWMVPPPGRCPWPQVCGCSSRQPLVTSDIAPDLGCGVAPPGRHPWPQTQGSSSRPLPLTSDVG